MTNHNALPGACFSGYKCKVFRIDDGGCHYVAARSIPEVYRLMAKSLDMTEAQYVEECEPEINELGQYEEIRINVSDDAPKMEITDVSDFVMFPKTAKLEVSAHIRTTAQEWMAGDYLGLISTTEF